MVSNISRVGSVPAATSRRALLGTLAATPLSVIATRAGASAASIAPSWPGGIDQPVALCRTRAGRRLSRFRYHNAESFFLGIENRAALHPSDDLYRIGIVLQLGLSSHLLDIGFDDSWCARHIGLQVSRSLACANATGLGFESADMALLAAILSPYGKWRHAGPRDADVVPFTAGQIHALARALLDRVHEVTGHPRPRGWGGHLIQGERR
jgi:hypothetical protein